MKKIKCAFCDKEFGSVEAARDHERMYHKKRLKKALAAQQEKEAKHAKLYVS